MKKLSALDAIDRTLNEKWIRIAEAETIDEMKKIFENNFCHLCFAYHIEDQCGCQYCLEMNERDVETTCCYEFDMFVDNLYAGNFKKATFWPSRLVDKIKKLRKKHETI